MKVLCSKFKQNYAMIEEFYFFEEGGGGGGGGNHFSKF